MGTPTLGMMPRASSTGKTNLQLAQEQRAKEKARLAERKKRESAPVNVPPKPRYSQFGPYKGGYQFQDLLLRYR